MAAGTSSVQPISFPTQITKTIVFQANNQEDLEYFTSKDQEGDVIIDLKNFADEIGLTLLEVDGEVIK